MDKPKILIVDDEPDVVSLLQRALTAEGFEAVCAYDGISAVDIADEEKPDMILLDIMMPMMSGYEVCEQLKSNPGTRDIPVLCVTSAHNPDTAMRAKNAGAQGILVKPFVPSELVLKIRRFLPTPQS